MRNVPLSLALLAATVMAQELNLEDHVRRCVVRITTVDRNLLKAQELRRKKAHPVELRKLEIHQLVPMRFAGVVISSKGEIVTPALHPRAPLNVIVEFHDGRKEPAEVVGTDPISNLALIRVDGAPRHHLDLAKEAPTAGTKVSVIGQGNLPGVVSKGTITQESLRLPIRDLYGLSGAFRIAGKRFIVLDSVFAISGPVTRPMPGTPCVDDKGRLVGMIFTVQPPTRRFEKKGGRLHLSAYEISMAIPSARIVEIVERLRSHGRIIRSHFGVFCTRVSDTLVAQFGLPASAAVILDVGPQGPCAHAGLRPNDVLLGINGKEFTDFEALGNALSNQIPGEEVTLTIMRAGKTSEFKVTPVERR